MMGMGWLFIAQSILNCTQTREDGSMTGIVLLIIGAGVIVIAVGYYLLSYNKDNLHPSERVGVIQMDKISIDMNRYAANKEAGASAARTNLGAQLNQESATYIEMINQQTAAKLAQYDNLMAIDRRQREDLILQAMQANQLLVYQAASEYRVTPATYEQMMIESVKLGHQVMLQGANQQLEIQKHFQMKLIEHQMEELTAGLKKEMLQFKNLLPYHQYEQLNQMLSVANGSLDLFKRTQFPSAELKERELKRMEAYIRTLKSKINEWKKNRLV
jgi:hypothetical protein